MWNTVGEDPDRVTDDSIRNLYLEVNKYALVGIATCQDFHSLSEVYKIKSKYFLFDTGCSSVLDGMGTDTGHTFHH